MFAQSHPPSNYRPDVETCLKSGKMTTDARKHFLSAVASAMFSFKRYMVIFVATNITIPTGIPQRKSLSLEIIDKYPFLKSQTGSPSVSFCEQ